MNLIIDVGNSFVKLAVFQNGLMKYKTSVRIKEVLAEVKELTRLYSEIDKAIISSVGKFSKDDITIISELVHLVVLDSNIMLPFKNLYKTPKTLGVDRLALVCASVSQFSEKYSDLTVILTGGDTKFLSKQLKSSIFANPNFLLEGLDFILQLNSNE